MRRHYFFSIVILMAVLAVGHIRCSAQALGIFESHNDVGTVLHPGSVDYDAASKTYTISGSGENMWLSTDAFQFVWKKMSGDVSLTADISFLNKTGNEHKKAALMFRQTLDADSVYADIALHASGLTSLQFRDEKGAITREVQSNLSAPPRLRIVKRGDYVYMALGTTDTDLKPAGGWLRIPLQGDFYVGLGVCSHDKDVVEQAKFSKVELTQPAAASGKPVLYSTLETVAVSSADRRVAYLAQGRFEAPNWTRDGSAFLFNRDGHIERLAVGSDKPVTIDTGFANRCNNDHGISPDSTQLAISDNSQGDHESMVYLVPIAGGTPRRITEKSPSYWHGWSPDGKTLAFVGERNGNFDIYAIPVAGGLETRLTTAKGLDDGPEYSPDGKYIYFNSERTGHMQIWRMNADGSNQEQVFSDDLNNWFPHISPDGQWMVFLTYQPDVSGHPENKDVMLRLMSLADKKITVLAKLFGGQGTINVPSWSPDSKQVAFVSYMLIPPGEQGAESRVVNLPGSAFHLAVPKDWAIYTDQSELRKINNGKGEWYKEYASIVNHALPFSNCSAQLGTYAWLSPTFFGVTVRAYILQGDSDAIRSAIGKRALKAAQSLHGTTVRDVSLVNGETGQWRRTLVKYDLNYGDYGGTANVDFYDAKESGQTIVLAFMYADLRDNFATVQHVLSSFSQD